MFNLVRSLKRDITLELKTKKRTVEHLLRNLEKRNMLFAGLQVSGKWGVSSEDVVLARRFAKFSTEDENPPIIFLPTVSSKEAEDRASTRIYVVKLSSLNDYLIVTRPFSFGTEEILSMAKQLRKKSQGMKIVASLAPSKLSELKILSSRFSDDVDAFEVDLGLMCIKHQYSRSFQAYAIDMLEEFVSFSPKTVLVKVSPNIPLSRDFLELLVETGISGIIFSPHPVYTIGKFLFRMHSPLLSTVYAMLWAGLITGLDVSTAFISDKAPSALNEHDIEGAYDLLLFDVALILKSDPTFKGKINPFPLKWANIPQGLVPAIDVEKEPYCREICPYKSYDIESPTLGSHSTIVSANSNCDGCGLCLSICETARLVKELAPEE